MSDIAYLAWRYLAHYCLRSLLLVAAVATIVTLPIGLSALIERGARGLRARAAATPLLVGAKGSPLELVLNSLYFESAAPASLRYGELARIESTRLAQAIPLHTRFRSNRSPIVGTSLDYFAHRRLRVAAGRQLAILGECVLGCEAAEAAGVGPGGQITSSPEGVLDITGVYPLRMRVVGVLAPAGTPDDRAVFVDVKTAWVIEGLAHGHQDLSQPDAAQQVLRTEGSTIVANASVLEYNEITPENLSSFHFHGDPATFPLTAIIAVPGDDRSGTLLLGQYLADESPLQAVVPGEVIERLLATVLAVRRYVLAGMLLVGAAAMAMMTLVFLLSLQLRRRELETMAKIGGSRRRIAAVVALEILSVLAAGILLAALMLLLSGWLADAATRILIRLV